MSANAMYTAITGLDTFSNALSVVSDNIANANTTAWKSNTARFGDLVSGYLATDLVDTKSYGACSKLIGISTDYGMGSTLRTGNWSDLTIQGNGYFNVEDPNGSKFFSRDGSFRVSSPDAANANVGYFTDSHNYYVLDSSGNKITVEADLTDPSYTNYEVDKSGVIWGTLLKDMGAATKGTRQAIATVGVTTFPNQDGLIRNGSNLYYKGATSGSPDTGTAGTGQRGIVVAGAWRDRTWIWPSRWSI